MYWQRKLERDMISVNPSETYKFDLPTSGLLGSLILHWSMNQVSGLGQSGGSWRPIDYITKVEIVANGSEIIKSLTGKQLAGISAFDQNVMPPSVWRNYASETQFEWLLLNFGRFLKDREVGLDLSKYQSVELWITNNWTVSQFTTPTLKIEGFYKQDDGVLPGFRGHIKSHLWRNWTTVTDEWKYLALPTDYKLRRILLQATPAVDANYVVDTNFCNLMYDIQCYLQTGKKRVFEGGLDDLIRENWWDNRAPFITGGQNYNFADKGFDVSLGYVMIRNASAGSRDGAGNSTVATIGAAESANTQHMETYEADGPVETSFIGVGPYLMGNIAFDDEVDPDTYLDTDAEKEVQLNVHTRNSASADNGTNSVILEQFVPA
jgi:hypothetical protein